MGLISQKIGQSLLRRRLVKAPSELGLHYFLCRINVTVVVKGLTPEQRKATSYLCNSCIPSYNVNVCSTSRLHQLLNFRRDRPEFQEILTSCSCQTTMYMRRPSESKLLIRVLSVEIRGIKGGVSVITHDYHMPRVCPCHRSSLRSVYRTFIFNHIFNSGVYPDSQSKGVHVPFYKKGDKSNPSNYRGITIIHVIVKHFSLVLRNRINKWCEETETLNNLQFGFRDERSTADCIFILHSIIQKVLANK